MAFNILPKDFSGVCNAVVSQVVGKTPLANVNGSDYISVGETGFAATYENTLNALLMLGIETRLDVARRSEQLKIIRNKDLDLFRTRTRKISFFEKPAQPLASFNTQNHTNLYEGYDNGTNGGASVGSQWEQNKPVPFELYFGGFQGETLGKTTYIKQLNMAMGNANAMADFWNGEIIEFGNRILRCDEAQQRTTLLNYIAGLFDMQALTSNGMARNLAAEYNAKFNAGQPPIPYATILTTYLREFLGFFLAEIAKDRGKLKEESNAYHWNPSVTRDGVTYSSILRETPTDKQKLVLWDEIFEESKTMVLPEIFNSAMLNPENFEAISFWQSRADGERSKIKFTPSIPDINNPTAQTVGNAVALDMVLGVLFDEESCEYYSDIDRDFNTAVEARKKYFNTWVDILFQGINDFTHAGILYYMAD